MHTIEKLVASALGITEQRITDNLSMKQTPEWDSLKHMELIVAIERSLGVELTGDDIVEMTSIAAIKSVLRRHGVL
jgi:acyl carrier protein